MTKLIELLGVGISHSVSPALWREIFAATGADFEYRLRDLPEDGLITALAALRRGRVHLYNITMPYKSWAYDVAETRSPEVAASFVANTLWLEQGRIASANTDVLAAQLLLSELPEPCESVLVLGAGATGRSLLTAARSHSAKVYLTNRSANRLEQVTARIPGVIVVPWEDRQDVAADVDLIVNTTPSGLVNDSSPLPDLSSSRLGSRTRYLYDLIYRADLTPLQRQAAEAGMPMVDGLAHLEAHARIMLSMIGLSMSPENLRTRVVAATGRVPRKWDLVSTS